jgi:hypothetical protein
MEKMKNSYPYWIQVNSKLLVFFKSKIPCLRIITLIFIASERHKKYCHVIRLIDDKLDTSNSKIDLKEIMVHKLIRSSDERPKAKRRDWGDVTGHVGAKPFSAVLDKFLVSLDLSFPTSVIRGQALRMPKVLSWVSKATSLLKEEPGMTINTSRV